MTTGLLPQSLIISFPQIVQIKEISLTSFKSNKLLIFLKLFILVFNLVRNLVIEKSIKSNPVDFEIVNEKCKIYLFALKII